MKHFWLNLLLIVCMSTTVNAGSPKSLNNWLMSDPNGFWIVKRWEPYLGTSLKCRAGVIWEFKKENKLVKKICRNERIITSEHLWYALEADENNERIKIDEEIFTIERLRKQLNAEDGLPPISTKVTVIRSMREGQDQPIFEIELIQSEF